MESSTILKRILLHKLMVVLRFTPTREITSLTLKRKNRRENNRNWNVNFRKRRGGKLRNYAKLS